jgi:uncharacterized protein (DUF1501 family)
LFATKQVKGGGLWAKELLKNQQNYPLGSQVVRRAMAFLPMQATIGLAQGLSCGPQDVSIVQAWALTVQIQERNYFESKARIAAALRNP